MAGPPDLDRAAAACPSCGGEYRAGFDICSDRGVALVPLGEDGGSFDDVRGTIEIVERVDAELSDASDLVVEPAGAGAEPFDLFYSEEHPVRVVLARLDPADARDVADRLERAGIGSRVAQPDEEGWAPVVVHDTRLPEAQAIAAEDPWERANRRAWGAGDPSHEPQAADIDGSETDADAFMSVARPAAADARANAERLADAGIDVRIVVDRDRSADGTAELEVPPDRVDDARRILHIEI